MQTGLSTTPIAFIFYSKMLESPPATTHQVCSLISSILLVLAQPTSWTIEMFSILIVNPHFLSGGVLINKEKELPIRDP